MAFTLNCYYSFATIVVLLAGHVSCQLCNDLDTKGCQLFIAQQADFCTTSSLASTACQRSCGNCPLTCYHCPQTPVNATQKCTTTKHCSSDEYCMINTLYAHDGHIEHILSCIDKAVCNGQGFGFNSIIGKRHEARDLHLHCCHTDLCNVPNFSTTTMPYTGSTVTPPGFYSCHSDIAFVVDESSSIGYTAFKEVISFIIDIVSHLDIGTHGDQVSLLLFDENPHLQWYLNDFTSKADLLNAFSYIPYHNGSTNIGVALKSVRDNVFQFKNGDRPSAKNVVVVITDGNSINKTQTRIEAANLRHDGARVIALGIGAATNSELQAVASSYNYALKEADYKRLPEAESLILQMIC